MDYIDEYSYPARSALANTLINLGLETPHARGLFYAVVAGLVLYWWKPRTFFNAGIPRGWVLLDKGPGSVTVPAWMLPMLVGFTGMLIA